ncbi:ATP-binding cassette domain-containing protein [Streptomyces sp. NBC_01023]|uniref:ABC transporter ATP-binding protein n=1 Tax=Streptomyces sp. NBC_01023 TaxID=2903724 RepID=UPI003866A67D|nr:ATP-binding cassette domain-containing protein [Streptomyces sp. NBC_01023]
MAPTEKETEGAERPVSTVVIRADDVDFVRDGNLLLDSVSLTVHSGEHWALLGANGAGKSTLLGLLGAVAHPTRGRVEILGRTLGRVDLRELRSHLGHINPRHPLHSPLRVRDVVLTGLTNSIEPVPRWSPTDEQVKRADRLLTMLGMGGEKAESRWPTLSQGERGRTLIARALMPSPRLVLLDEPATGLDLAAREQLLTSLDELRAEHPELATILVTHHLEELPASTTHAMLLSGGACLGSGPADEVLTTDQVSKCFDHPVRITRTDGRWAARSERAAQR